MMYETRKEAAAACIREAAFTSHYSNAAIEYANRGECKKEWSLADTARTAARCAMQAHEDLWEIAGEDMTEAEFDAFEKAEIAQTEAARAERAAAAAVEKLNRQPVLTPEIEELCKTTGTRTEGIAALMTYYTDNCGWSEQKAVAHIKGLFENGTIAALKLL